MGNKGSSDLVLPFYEEIICWNQIFFYLIDTAWRRIKSFIFHLLWFMGRQRFTITWSKMSHHQRSSQKRKGTEVAVSGAGCQGVWAWSAQRGGQRCPGAQVQTGGSVRHCTWRQPSRLKSRPATAVPLASVSGWCKGGGCGATTLGHGWRGLRPPQADRGGAGSPYVVSWLRPKSFYPHCNGTGISL